MRVTRVLWDLRRATLASLHFKLSNANVASPRVQKKKKCLNDHICALGNTFHYLVQQPNIVHFPVKSSKNYLN